MSVFVAAHGSIYPREDAPTIWYGGVTSGAIINEGGSTTFNLRVVNYVPGTSRIIWWMTGGSASPGRWLKSWDQAFREACVPQGINVTTLSRTGTPAGYPAGSGTLDMLLEIPVGSTYHGQEIKITNTSRVNHRDDQDPTTAQCVLFAKVSSRITPAPDVPDPDVAKQSATGGNIIQINDTSKRPTQVPTFTLVGNDISGGATKIALGVGDGIQLTFKTTYMLPGTKIKVYAANDGQDMIASPGFRGMMLRALTTNPPPGITYEATNYPPPAGQSWYKGYTIVFGQDYDDSKPFTMPFYIGQTPEDGTSVQMDVITQVVKEGTASDFDTYQSVGDYNANKAYVKGDWINYPTDGLNYIALQGTAAGIAPGNTDYWREYVPVQVLNSYKSFLLKENPPRYWEVRGVVSGSTINYSVNCPITPGSTVQWNYNNAPPGFLDAFTAACAAAGSPITLNAATLTVNSNVSKSLHSISFSVPHAGSGIHRWTLANVTDSYIGIQETAVFLSAVTLPTDPKFVTGVNMSSADFGASPGNYFSDYEYPSFPERSKDIEKHMEMDYIWKLGIRVARLPILWNRVQRGAYASLYGEKTDPNSPWDQSYDIARMDELIYYWTVVLGGRLIIDLHNYGNGPFGKGKVRYDPQNDTENTAFPIDVLCDFWVKIATRYLNNPKVWFGLMNEPNGGSNGPWDCRMIFQTVVNAIRGRTGSLAKILVPGTAYCSAANWVANGQGDAYTDFYDPANNFAFEPHCYVDSDASGTVGTCVIGTQNRINDITTWARSNSFKLWIGEVAGGDPSVSGQSSCNTVMSALYTNVKNNKDVWLGYSCWGYGKRWPSTYPFYMNPVDYITPSAPAGCMQMFIPFIAEEY